MDIRLSDVVRATAGRDKDKLFFVVGMEDGMVFLADGKGRRLEAPKRKKLKHVRLEARRDCRAAVKLQSGAKVTNSELRRALAEFSAESGEEKGGMEFGER